MITDQIGHTKFCYQLIMTGRKFVHFRFFKIKTLESLRVFLQADKKKKPFKRARDGAYCLRACVTVI